MFSSESSNRFSCKHPLEQVLKPQPHKMPGMIYFIAVLFCGWRCFETGICRHCLLHITCRLLTIASWRHRCECLAGLATSSTFGADDSQVSFFTHAEPHESRLNFDLCTGLGFLFSTIRLSSWFLAAWISSRLTSELMQKRWRVSLSSHISRSLCLRCHWFRY